VNLDAHFWTALFEIMVINVALSGDNAVVIAMAANKLPHASRRKAIVYGAGAAVLARIVFTLFVAQLLAVPFVKLVGGAVIIWVALKLFDHGEETHGKENVSGSLWEAVKIIVIADVSMGLDNMLAVAGAARGSMTLIWVGLAVSIPIVVFASEILSRLMERYPVIVYVGAAILGKVGGEMMITDSKVEQVLHPSKFVEYSVTAVFAALVVVGGLLMTKRAEAKKVARREVAGTVQSQTV